MLHIVESARSSCSKAIGFICAAVLALMLGACAFAASAQEAHADNYQYTITLYAGNGQIDGKDSVVVGTYGYGQKATVDWTKYDITLPDDRYYVKGVRLAGHDDSSVSAPSFEVTENAQYVIAYGLKKDQTSYTVNYVDVDGNQLMESQTFKGNVGDKPVVAYQYIEGYQPQNAFNITGTLSANNAANEFTFVYENAVSSEGAVAAVEGGGEEGTAGEGTEDEAVEGEEAEEGTEAGPAELIDIDDEDNPLANIGAENERGFGIADVLPWVLGALVAAALIAFIVLLVARKRHASDNA